MVVGEWFIGSTRIDCSLETIIGTPFMYSPTGSGLTIAIREPMVKTPLSLAIRNIWNKTVFYVELWMTQNRPFSWYMFVSEQKQKKIIRW